MEQARYEFGWVRTIRADAIGKPGQRRFRLLIESKVGSCCLWLEKEQLYTLAMAIKQLLLQVPSESQPPPKEPSRQPPGDIRLEFTVGEMFLEHDEGTGAFSLMAKDATTTRQKGTTFRCRADRGQIEALSEEALQVCAAGRSLCPLCYAPMGPERHICPKGNGHIRHGLKEGGHAQA